MIILAIGFRFYDITHYPPGLFPDQAANGEDVLLILDGDARPFYPRGNGREALFFYLQAASIKMFGIGVWPMFAASAAVGVATVVAVYFATRVFFGRLAGLLAALFLATSHWHVTLSRTGFRAIMIPLFVAAFTAFAGYSIQAVRERKIGLSLLHAALAGAAFAAGFYTYIAYRIMLGVVLGMFIFLLLAALHPKIGFPHLKRYRWQVSVAVLTALIVIAPFVAYFIQQPDAFVGRAGQVSVFSPDLQREYGGGKLLPTILYSLRETLLSFFAGGGDLNWRHNVAGFPLLNPLVGLLFLLGLAWAIHGLVEVGYKIWRGEELHLDMVFPYLLLLLAGMLVPVITTAEGMPHGLRSIGLVAPMFILAGTAGSVCLYWVWYKVGQPVVRTALLGSAAGVVLVGMVYDGSLYFLIARNTAAAHYAYRADLTEVAEYINEYHRQQPDSPRPYLALDKFSLQTVHFLTSVAAHDHVVGEEAHPDEAQHRWQQVDPQDSQRVQLTEGEHIIFTQSSIPDAERFAITHQNIEVVAQRFNRFGQEIMRVYRSTASSAPSVDIPSLDA